MTCVYTTMPYYSSGVPLAAYLAPSLIGAFLLIIFLPLAFLYWRRVIDDVANYKQIWHKRRYLPATINLATVHVGHSSNVSPQDCAHACATSPEVSHCMRRTSLSKEHMISMIGAQACLPRLFPA